MSTDVQPVVNQPKQSPTESPSPAPSPEQTNSFIASLTVLRLKNIESLSEALKIIASHSIQTTKLTVLSQNQNTSIPFATFSLKNGKLKSVPDMKLTTDLESQLTALLSSAQSTKILDKSQAPIITSLKMKLLKLANGKLIETFIHKCLLGTPAIMCVELTASDQSEPGGFSMGSIPKKWKPVFGVATPTPEDPEKSTFLLTVFYTS